MKTYIQISAGRGPVECARVVYLVYEKLIKDLDSFEIIDKEPHNDYPGCFMSMTISVDLSEDKIRQLQDKWGGTIQFISTHNSYRPNHKRKNWFVGVSFLDSVNLYRINESDIIYETCRSGGKGGQNVNKVETAVRATYKDISIKCSDERSQLQNKKIAKERLLLRLAEMNSNIEQNKSKEKWSKHTELERGNPKRVFKGEI